MRLDWSTLALQTINFSVLVWLLHRFLYAPVLRMIDARKAEIAARYDDAKATEDKAKAYLTTIEAERAGMREEREEALKSAAAQAKQAADALHARTERDAQALLDGARKTLAEERERALEEARRVALDLGGEFARRLLAEVPKPLPAEAWIAPIEARLEALPKPEFEALSRELAEGGVLTVVTASPLAPPAREAWRDKLRQLFGQSATIGFNVDLDLMAGAELHFPAAVLRFSWRSALASMQSELGARAANAR